MDRTDVFDFAGVREAQECGIPDARTSVLSVQFRMAEGICCTVNEFAYGGLLRAHPLASKRGIRLADGAPFEESEVVVFDTSRLHTVAALEAAVGSFSRYNLYSAALSLLLAQALRQGPVKSVGLLSPFRAQAELLAAMAKGTPNIDAATVHRFQGGERDAIVLDLVEAYPLEGASRLTGTDPELGLRLLNVVASRARGKLVIVSDLTFLDDRHPLNSRTRELIECAVGSGATEVDGLDYLVDLIDSEQLASAKASVFSTLEEAVAPLLVGAPEIPLEVNLPDDRHWTESAIAAVRAMSNATTAPLIRGTTKGIQVIEDVEAAIALTASGPTPFFASDDGVVIGSGDSRLPWLTVADACLLPTIHRLSGVE